MGKCNIRPTAGMGMGMGMGMGLLNCTKTATTAPMKARANACLRACVPGNSCYRFPEMEVAATPYPVPAWKVPIVRAAQGVQMGALVGGAWLQGYVVLAARALRIG